MQQPGLREVAKDFLEKLNARDTTARKAAKRQGRTHELATLPAVRLERKRLWRKTSEADTCYSNVFNKQGDTLFLFAFVSRLFLLCSVLSPHPLGFIVDMAKLILYHTYYIILTI